MAQKPYDFAKFLEDQGDKLKCNLARVVSWLVSTAPAQIIDALLVAKKDKIGDKLIGDRDSEGLTSIIVASRAGRDDIVDILLKKGANIYDRYSKGRNSIIHAAIGCHVKVVELLLARNESILFDLA